jgi:prepilin-type N-terminal cleavage/methylation domain-containing protein
MFVQCQRVAEVLRSKSGPWRRHAAFTLIEILVTLVILSTGIVVVLRAFESSVVALSESRDTLFGSMLAREKLVEIESSLAQGDSFPPDSNGWFEGAFEKYRWAVESRRATATTEGEDRKAARLQEVQVTIWRDGSEQRRTFVTYLIAE